MGGGGGGGGGGEGERVVNFFLIDFILFYNCKEFGSTLFFPFGLIEENI